MEFNTDQFVDQCVSAINDRLKNLKTLNIIVAGKTGVGKSTLINNVFRENLAYTGMGKPITTHMRKISKEGFPLNIYDNRGFELGVSAQDEVKKEVLDTVNKGVESKDINQMIHCIWYCINTASNRIEQGEMDWLREFSEANQKAQVPVIIVLTQSFSKKKAQEMKQIIENEKLGAVAVVPVLAEDYPIGDEYVAKAYGLDDLIRVMEQHLPEELVDTLQNVQRVSLKEKKRAANKAIAAATAAAFGEGFTPIPFADSALLIPTQAAMIARITSIFGLEVNKSVLTSFLSAAVGTVGATFAGKTIVSGIMKLVPGAGTLAGGLISGTTAGAITTALGRSYVSLMEAMYNGEFNANELGLPTASDKMKTYLGAWRTMWKDLFRSMV